MLSYMIFTVTLCGIYALLALSLNLAWGGVGLVNLGLSGFYAVGAYASAIATGAGAPVLIGWAAAIVAGAVAGLAVTLATVRLRDDYLAIVTLGFSEVIRLVALNERWLTRGRGRDFWDSGAAEGRAGGFRGSLCSTWPWFLWWWVWCGCCCAGWMPRRTAGR